MKTQGDGSLVLTKRAKKKTQGDGSLVLTKRAKNGIIFKGDNYAKTSEKEKRKRNISCDAAWN